MPRSTASSTSTAASRRARRAGNHKPPKSSRGADADPALRSPLARVAEKHGVEVVIKFLSTSARARAVTLEACRCALERACDASATRANRVLLALEIAFRDFTGAMARYACPDVEDAGRRQLLERVVGVETSRDDGASTSSVVLPGQDDTLASWLRATVASNGREGAGKDDEVSKEEDDASSVGTSATSRDLDCGGRADAGPIFGELYARCQYANALLQASTRARTLFDDVDLVALKPGTSMESARVEWRRCASAFRAAQCEGEAFLSAVRGQSWIRGASLELSRAPEDDRAAIDLTLTHMQKRATIGLTLALERWNRLVQTYARDMRDIEGELAMKMKKSLREFLRTYDVTGVDMSTKDIDDVERVRERIELGGRVREFLLNAINDWNADVDVHDITTVVVEKVDGTVDRALKAFAVRAESNERDAHLDFTNHLLLEASWAFRRARLVVADAAFGEDVASFDHARSAAATNALLVGENLARLRA
jgi:hypothetical protein